MSNKDGYLKVLKVLFGKAAGAKGLRSNETFIQILALPYIGVGPWASHFASLSLHFLLSKTERQYLTQSGCRVK